MFVLLHNNILSIFLSLFKGEKGGEVSSHYYFIVIQWFVYRVLLEQREIKDKRQANFYYQ